MVAVRRSGKRSKKKSKKKKRRSTELVVASSGDHAAPSVPVVTFSAFPQLEKQRREHVASLQHPRPVVNIRRNYPFLGVHSVHASFYDGQKLGVHFKARGGHIVVSRLNRQFGTVGLAEKQGVAVGDVVTSINSQAINTALTSESNSHTRSQIKADFRRLQERPLHLVLWRFDSTTPRVAAAPATKTSVPPAASQPTTQNAEVPPKSTNAIAVQTPPATPARTSKPNLIPIRNLAVALRDFYRKHKPEKIANIPAILSKSSCCHRGSVIAG